MLWRNRVAKVAAPKWVGRAIKWAKFENRSTMTHIVVFPADRGKWVMTFNRVSPLRESWSRWFGCNIEACSTVSRHANTATGHSRRCGCGVSTSLLI